MDFADVRWVMLAHGVRVFEPDETIEVFIDPRHMMAFDETGRAVSAPAAGGIGEERWRGSISTTSGTPTWPIRESDADYALKEVHHTFDDGGAYALLGPSGCGKTTLLNIISGLIHPSRGSLLFDGRDVTELSTQERNIAQVFQFPVDLRHHDGLRQSGVPAQQSRRAGGRRRPQGPRDPRR